MADLTDRLAYVDALAQVDAELAVKVANLKNRLRAFETQLERQQELEVEALEEARAEKREVASLFDHQQSLLDQQQDLLQARSAPSSARRPRGTRVSRSSAPPRRDAIGGRIWDGRIADAVRPRPAEFCPSRRRRPSATASAPPRYAGGYHLHKGVDIVAPMSAEIYAPFDGQAYTSSNSLGGNVVFVVGALGDRLQRPPLGVLRPLEQRRLGR